MSRREGAEPFAVYSDDAVIGFALLVPLGEGEPDGSMPPAGTVRGSSSCELMIDRRFQGGGFGRAAPEAIAELVRTRRLPTIRRSVVLDNKHGLEFYRRNGFVERGEMQEASS